MIGKSVTGIASAHREAGFKALHDAPPPFSTSYNRCRKPSSSLSIFPSNSAFPASNACCESCEHFHSFSVSRNIPPSPQASPRPSPTQPTDPPFQSVSPLSHPQHRTAHKPRGKKQRLTDSFRPKHFTQDPLPRPKPPHRHLPRIHLI